jgi:hypothetical protein
MLEEVPPNATERCVEFSNWINPQNRVPLDKAIVTKSRNHPYFRQPEGSLPIWQKPSTCPYREPDESSAVPLRFILILSSHLRLGLPSDLFPSPFSQQNSVCTSLPPPPPPRHACPSYPPLFCRLFKWCVYYCLVYTNIFWLHQNTKGLLDTLYIIGHEFKIWMEIATGNFWLRCT